MRMDVMNEIAFTADEITEIKLCLPQYAFYTKKPAYVRWYCSNCEQWYEEYYDSDDMYDDPIPRHYFEHNGSFRCPHCGKTVTAKSIGRGFKTLEDTGCFVVCRNIEGRFRMFVSRIRQSFDKDCKAIRKTDPRYLYEFDESGKLHKWSWNCLLFDSGTWHWRWQENKSLTPFPHDSWIYNYHYDQAYLINPESFEMTAQRYCGAENFVGPYCTARDFVAYICLYGKHPNVEYIVKQNFGKVIANLLNRNQRSLYINWRSNNFLKMLGIRSKNDIDLCRRMEIEQLELYRKLSKSYAGMAELIVHQIRPGACELFPFLINLTGYSPDKICRYLKKQKRSVRYWLDYLEMAKKIYGNNAETAPKDLTAAHDRCVDIQNAQKQEELRRFSEARNKKLKAFVWQENGLMIVLPRSVDDIVAESKALAHCVGGYAERHFKGQTTILFLRKTNEPDKPFYTMEINKTGKIQQCYGYRNNTANNPKPPEVKAFERHYEQYLQEVIHGKRNHRAARQSA